MGLVDFIPALLRATRETLLITCLGFFFATVLALPIALAQQSGGRSLRRIVAVYLTVARGTSAVVQLFWIFFVLPAIGFDLSPRWALVATIAFNGGAYGTEIIRGALRAIPHGQLDAARVVGLPSWAILIRIHLRQALPAIVPPYGVLFIEALKLSSLASLVTLTDLTFAAQLFRTTTGQSLQIFAVVLAIYWAIASLISSGYTRLEKLFAYPGYSPPRFDLPAT